MLRLILCMLTFVSVFGSEWYWPQEYKDTNLPILWMTTSDVNTIPQYMFDTWQSYTRGFDVRIYNDTQARAELVEQGSSRVLDLFDRLRPPHKYDLWRVCMLWHYGGFYMDIKTVLKRPLSSIFDPGKLLMTNGHRTDQGMHLGFMGGPARHPVFLRWISKVLKRGFPDGEWYHVYCRMMESVLANHTRYVLLQESNVSYVGCVPDRYGLCGRILDEQGRVVAHSRDPKYPWRTDAGVVNRLYNVNGEYFALSSFLKTPNPTMKSIPHKIHFIWMQKNLLTDPLTSQTERDNAENIRATVHMNPEYDVHFYDDTACQRECRQTGIEGVPELYEDMRGATSFGPSSWASMSDICRMAILYNHGGVYMDTNMAMRLPFKAWLREDVSVVAPMSACKHKRDLFNSLLGASHGHNATRFALERMVRDWDGHTFQAMATHYNKDELSEPFCLPQMGTIYSFLGWNATDQEHTQLLDERIHFENTFKDVPRRSLLEDKWYTQCNTIVVDPESGVVPFYSHMLKRDNCSMKD